MDFMEPGPLLSSMVISTIGLSMFVYGKKMQKFPSLGIGLAMMIFPVFVHSILWMWLIAAGCSGSLYVLTRNA